MTEDNPFNKMVVVDGFIVLLETLPLELQEIIKHARSRGEDIEFQTEQR